MMNQLNIIAFTHKNLEVSDLGLLHIAEENQQNRLLPLKEQLNWSECMFLSTCNRVEYLFCSENAENSLDVKRILKAVYPQLEKTKLDLFAHTAEIHQGELAVQHLLAVASSIDSMVVGEREIITQVRKAFNYSKNIGLTGDFIRLLIRHTIETAKRVYTETSIARKPVSVVSLAYHRLRDMQIPLGARIIIVGAGQTNANMSRFLRKHGFKNFTVFNRTFSKAEALASELGGKALSLNELSAFSGGFDVLLTCTGSENHIITKEIYTNLLNGEEDRKVVIDLALPQDLDPKIPLNYQVTHISIEQLQKISSQHLKERSQEIYHVEEILSEAMFSFRQLQRLRKVELAMREVPEKVKEIKTTALNNVFRKELDSLDDPSRELLEKIIGYMEKKYMSVPMLMAKDILLNNSHATHTNWVKGK
jgi:glutamyl-tRNA reductase